MTTFYKLMHNSEGVLNPVTCQFGFHTITTEDQLASTVQWREQLEKQHNVKLEWQKIE